MKIDTKNFAIALGSTAALLWIICSAMAGIAPASMMAMTGHMLHADLTQTTWQMSISGVLTGLFI